MSELGVRIGENIRIYRRANRMTLNELADRINKSKATVGKYEQGAIALDMDTLYEIAAALKVSPAQLMVSLLPENEDLTESLLLTKEDIRLTRRCNMFIVEQINWMG